MFSVTPEPAISTPAPSQRASQPRAARPSPDDFGALINGSDRPDVRATEPRRSRDPSAPPAKADDAATAMPDVPAATAGDTAPQPAAKGQVKTADAKTADAKADKDETADARDDATPVADSAAADGVPQSAVAVAVIIPVTATAPQIMAPAASAMADPVAASGAAGDATVAPAAVLQAQVEAAGPQPGATLPAAPAAKAKPAATAATLAKDATDSAAARPAVATDDAARPATAAPQGDTAAPSKTAGNAGLGESAGDTAKAQPARAHHASVGAAPDAVTLPDPAAQLAATPPPLPQATTAAAAAVPAQQFNVALVADTPVPLGGLAVDIALRAAGGNSRFEIRLDPAELGRIDVRLEVDKHGNVTSHLTVERPATLDMLRNDAPKLQQALEDAGLKTGDGGLQFSLRDRSSSGQDNERGSGGHSARLVISEDDTVPAQVAGRSYGRMLGASSGVDIRI